MNLSRFGAEECIIQHSKIQRHLSMEAKRSSFSKGYLTLPKHVKFSNSKALLRGSCFWVGEGVFFTISRVIFFQLLLACMHVIYVQLQLGNHCVFFCIYASRLQPKLFPRGIKKPGGCNFIHLTLFNLLGISDWKYRENLSFCQSTKEF